MRHMAILRAVMLALACLGLILPTPLLQAAATPEDSTPAAKQQPSPQAKDQIFKAIDVGLHKDNVLLGQVVDAQGKPQPKTAVSLWDRDRALAKIATNESGYFAVSKVPPGTYRLAAGESQGVFRLWAPNTAPPAAQPGALLVVGQGPVRGQQSPIVRWLSNPLVIAGLIATAVAVPIAVHNHNKERHTATTDSGASGVALHGAELDDTPVSP